MQNDTNESGRRPARHDANSRDAWDRFRKGSGELTVNGRILELLTNYGPGTCDAIEQAIHVKHQTVSAQLSHLRDDGEVEIVRQIKEEGRTVNLYGIPTNQLGLAL